MPGDGLERLSATFARRPKRHTVRRRFELIKAEPAMEPPLPCALDAPTERLAMPLKRR
jgi:hypothetical protein